MIVSHKNKNTFNIYIYYNIFTIYLIYKINNIKKNEYLTIEK
jgi:hypothetical protein